MQGRSVMKLLQSLFGEVVMAPRSLEINAALCSGQEVSHSAGKSKATREVIKYQEVI